MMKKGFVKIALLFCVLSLFPMAVSAQQTSSTDIKSQEISEDDGIPVLIKHLPDWENARNSATLITNANELRNALGSRPVFDAVEFIAGTEAVTAAYPQGKLLIVEYSTPQASVDTDNKVRQFIGEDQTSAGVFYRRIGNYNVFLFDGGDEDEANALFDQIKYEKVVQWLGEDPTLLRRAERAIVESTSDVIISTATAIVFGLLFALLTGIVVGLLFFRFRNQRRSGMKAFSDAGGMVRLNLDELTPQILPERLLKD